MLLAVEALKLLKSLRNSLKQPLKIANQQTLAIFRKYFMRPIVLGAQRI